MKKLLLLAFVVMSAVACSKKPAANTTPTQPDSKMEAAPAEGETKPAEGEAKPEGDAPAADPCAGGQ